VKKLAKISFLLFVALFSCTIRDGEIIDLINSVKKQNDDLKAQIYALKKTTDSALVAALKINTLQILTDKKIDQIQADLKALLSQIVSLNTQMSALNADIGPLKAKIDVLQTKCAELLAQIATLNYNLNSKGFTKIDNLTWTQVISGNSWRLLANLDSSVLYLSRLSNSP
jgi:cell division protein FtsB